MTQEEAAEIMSVLVQEVCRMLTLSGPDLVEIAAAETIDVQRFQPVREIDMKGAVEMLKQELRRRMATRLSQLEHRAGRVMAT